MTTEQQRTNERDNMPRCSICNEQFERPYDVTKHRKEAHGIERSKPKSSNKSAIDMILDAQQQIKQALSKIDEERAQIQQRLLDLDTMAAKYKKLI